MLFSRVSLANVEHPPDTSRLQPCEDRATKLAICNVRRRVLRKREALGGSTCAANELDGIVAALRRLQSSNLRAYERGSSAVLSEPFNAVPASFGPAPARAAQEAVKKMFGGPAPARLARVLGAFGEPALRAAVAAGVRITVVPDSHRFSEFSAAVAQLVPGLDDWPSPPSGLFVVEERRVLLRNRALGMTAAHEFAHALDSVLAARKRSYYSYESDCVRRCFSSATGFVNEYAASGLDEYFAECVRAYVEVNDSRCAWLPLTRRDLQIRDPRMFALIERLFASNFTGPTPA